MADTPTPAVLYVVSEVRADKQWHELLATRDESEARALLKHLGATGKIEKTKPRPKLW